MKSLINILAISSFAIYECFAQGVMTMKTDKSNYSYGDSIQVSVIISNNTDSTFTIWGGSCMVTITFDTVYFYMPCTTSEFPHSFPPGTSRIWTWELVPSILGIPTQDGEQTIYGYCHGNGAKDSIKIMEPKYYGGRLDVSYKLGTPANKIQSLRDSLNATVISRDTLTDFGILEEVWQIRNYSIDSLANLYSKDSTLQSIFVERHLGSAIEIVTSVNQIPKMPSKYNLSQNYPNPFNPTTVISYSIPKENIVTIKVYDILGNEVANLVNEEKPAGSYSVNFNASKLSSGVYFYRMQAGSFMGTKKLILLK
ncbi:MAG: T9SS type A sorting domain-containing protein [Ignavibacteriaceae bacterium]